MKTIHGSWFTMAAAACAAMIVSCTAFGPRDGDEPTCTGTLDDGVACTADVCDATSGTYQHIPNDENCSAGEMCDADDGCVDRDPVCPASCDDGIACTVDSCVSGACRHTANDDACPDGDVCRASAADGASGCHTPPTMEECDANADCNDGVSCTTDRCVSGECRYYADDSLCSADQHCSATAGCVDDMPPAGDFHCLENGLVGDAIRIHPDANGVRTIGSVESASGPAAAPRDMSSGSGVILWGLEYGHPLASPSDRDADGEMHVGAPGSVYEYGLDGTAGGGINTMLYLPDGDVVFNWSDLRPFDGRPASDIGYWVEARQDGAWVRLPDRFVQILPDTVGARWSTARELDPALRGTVAIRVVIFTSGTVRCGS